MKLDKKDFQILEQLKANGRMSTQKIARKIGYPITTVHNRIKRLEENGVIRQYTIIPDHELLDMGLTALIMISIDYKASDKRVNSQKEIAREIKKISGIEEVNIVTGDMDIIAKARVSNIRRLNKLITTELRNVPGVDKTISVVVLEEI